MLVIRLGAPKGATRTVETEITTGERSESGRAGCGGGEHARETVRERERARHTHARTHTLIHNLSLALSLLLSPSLSLSPSRSLARSFSLTPAPRPLAGDMRRCSGQVDPWTHSPWICRQSARPRMKGQHPTDKHDAPSKNLPIHRQREAVHVPTRLRICTKRSVLPLLARSALFPLQDSSSPQPRTYQAHDPRVCRKVNALWHPCIREMACSAREHGRTSADAEPAREGRAPRENLAVGIDGERVLARGYHRHGPPDPCDFHRCDYVIRVCIGAEPAVRAAAPRQHPPSGRHRKHGVLSHRGAAHPLPRVEREIDGHRTSACRPRTRGRVRGARAFPVA